LFHLKGPQGLIILLADFVKDEKIAEPRYSIEWSPQGAKKSYQSSNL